MFTGYRTIPCYQTHECQVKIACLDTNAFMQSCRSKRSGKRVTGHLLGKLALDALTRQKHELIHCRDRQR